MISSLKTRGTTLARLLVQPYILLWYRTIPIREKKQHKKFEEQPASIYYMYMP